MMQVRIRPVRIEDAQAIAAILNAIIKAGAYTVFDTPLTVAEERRYSADFPQRGIFHVAVEAHSCKAIGRQLPSRSRVFARPVCCGIITPEVTRDRGERCKAMASTKTVTIPNLETGFSSEKPGFYAPQQRYQ